MDLIYDKTLEWVNEVRFYEGLGEPLTELPRGYPTQMRLCPVARALCGAEVIPGWIEHPDLRFEYKGSDVPEAVSAFIIQFDDGDYPELIAAQGTILREPLPVAEPEPEVEQDERELVLA